MSENVKSIFMSAISGKSPDQWPQFLDDACRNDAALRDQVEKFLNAHLAMGSIHISDATPMHAYACDPFDFIKPGTEIGRYTVLEQIGEGGMGTVYVAEQKAPMRRTVALKVIKAGMDTRQVIARFEAERQALAMMNHPNIAHVLDGGTTEQGRPYFVMELVKGLPITEFCDNKKLDIRARIELFVQVCGAVQHAHQKGIIHRDLKPSNILVEEHETALVPKVIDFGVAKATQQQLTEHSLQTGLSQMIGTPLYMSPEQMNSQDVDTRSDVYTLGVLLYELLTGSTPFDTETLKQAGFDEMRRIIQEVEPLNPSTQVSTLNAESLSTIAGQRQIEPRKLSQQFRGELDWIVMKAMEKDRNRRYDSASAIARDVERYLADEPIEARPASAGYRLKKFLSRNKGPAIAASLLVLGLVITSILSLLLVARGRELALRRNVVQEGISAALAKVVHLRNQASTQPQESQALLSQAREQMQRAVALSEAGQSTPEMATQVRRLLEELDQEHQDAKFERILDEAWIARANTDAQNQRWAPEQCIPILSKALETRGVRVGQS